MIDMTGDVDEAGWQYSLKFHGAVWHGNYKHFRSFVRRRRWIRLRCRPTTAKNELSEEPSSTIKIRTLVDVEEEQEAIPLLSPEASSSVVPLREQEIMERLHKCRLDRERLSVLDNVIKSLLPGLEEKLLEKASIFLDLFDYEDSKYKFLSSLLDKKYGSSFNQFKLTEQEKKAIGSLQFYYDVQTILDQIDPEQKVY
ncbi:MAG: hypothetical protein EXX96DRAFT_554003 [Benjaminiella poitrasii]|nr:MAG: hypothetical protein EXX96DRAFT_554003 [Benjaminiella poitrasii]